MPVQVVNGAQLACTFGTTPSNLVVLPARLVNVENQPSATVMDFVPMTNIMPFGMCITPSNPQVAAATSAALGVLTPQPCIPFTVAPWTPGGVTVNNTAQVTLDNVSKCTCTWGGMISITNPGQTASMVP